MGVGLVKTVRLNIITDPGTSKEKLDAITLRAEKLGALNPEIKVKIDSAAAALKLQVLKHELKDTGTQSDSLGGKISELSARLSKATPGFANLAAAGVALGPAVLPVIAAVTGAAVGMGAAIVAGGAAVGLFAAVAKSHLAEYQKELLKVQAANLAASKALATPAAKRTQSQKDAIDAAKTLTAEFNKQFGAMAAAQEKMTSAWKSFSGKPFINTSIADGMKLITSALPHLTPLLRTGAVAADAFTSVLSQFVHSGGLDRLVKGLSGLGSIALGGFTAVLINLGHALGALAGPAGKFATGAIDGLVRLSRAFADWATEKGPAAFTGFFAEVQRVSGPVLMLVKELVDDIPVLVAGLNPLAPVSLAIATALTRLVANVPPKVITGLAFAFLGLWSAIKIVSGAEAIFKGIGAATKVWAAATKVMAAAQFLLDSALDANPIGVTIIAVAALVGGLILLYKHSALFREIVQATWGWIRDHWPLLLGILTGPIGALAVLVVKNFDTIKRIVSDVIQFIERSFLTMAIDAISGIRDIVQAATHLPFVGSKFRGIADDLQGVIDKLRGVRDGIGKIHGKSVHIVIHGDGTFKVGTTGNIGKARGGLITGGMPGRDSVPIMAMPGELVVPVPMVNAGAVDHLRGRIPGFAQGGVVGSYGNGVAGLGPWLMREDAATVMAIERAVAKAVKAAMHSGMGILPYAESFVGKVPYVWGGTTPGGWDCSGFAGWVYKHFGYDSIPRTSQEQARWVRRTSGPIPGGLAFFAGSDGTAAAPGHVGIIVNGSTMVDAFGTGFGTRFNSLADMVFAGIPPQGFDNGGYLQPGLTLAYNGTGAPEPVGRTAGSTYNINVYPAPLAHPRDVGREVVAAIRAFEQGSGKGWRS
jgi:hypothetical protein